MLMHPAEPNSDNASRAPLLIALAVDAGATIALLFEMRWRTVYFDYLLWLGIVGLATVAVGALSCVRRMPAVLGVFAVAAFIQFVVSALHLQCLAQLVHCVVQPVLVSFSLTLRKACIPLWFGTGRSRVA